MTRELSSLVTTLNSSHFWSNGIQILLSALVRIASLCQKSLLKYHKLWSSKPNSVFITIYVLRVSTFDFLLYLSLTQHLIGKQTNKHRKYHFVLRTIRSLHLYLTLCISHAKQHKPNLADLILIKSDSIKMMVGTLMN